jgi:hypothetical protein
LVVLLLLLLLVLVLVLVLVRAGAGCAHFSADFSAGGGPWTKLLAVGVSAAGTGCY